jgi:prepilin-type N-terminal cleavage/methylation domain-containing protein
VKHPSNRLSLFLAVDPDKGPLITSFNIVVAKKGEFGNSNLMKRNKSISAMCRAFTLIEMIGVLAIIGILASVVAPKVFDAIRDAKITGAVGVLQTIKSSCVDYARKYNRFPVDGTKPPPASYERPYGDGLEAPVAEGVTNFGDLLIGEGILERLVLPIGPAGEEDWVNDLVTVSSPADPYGAAPGTVSAVDRLNYPVIVCRSYISLSAGSRLFSAAQNSVRVIMLVIPDLTTLEAAGIKTKIDGPFDEEVNEPPDLVDKTVSRNAEGRSRESINRGNCRLTLNRETGRLDAFLYVAHE